MNPMTLRFPLHAAWTLLLSLAALAPRVTAAEPPREELLGLLPSEPAFCVAVQDLEKHWQRLQGSRVWKQLEQMPFMSHVMASEPMAKLQELDQNLQTHLQTSVAQIRADVLGKAFVLAYWQAEGGRPEVGLFLARARDKELPGRVLTRMRDLQLQSGELAKADGLQHAGLDYHRCVDANGKVSIHFVHDGMTVIGNDEATVKSLIDRLRVGSGKRTNVVAQELKDLGVADDVAVIWVNPRAFDAQMTAKLRDAAEPEATFLRGLDGYWRKTTGLAVALQLTDRVEAKLSLRMLTEALSPAATTFLQEAKAPSAFWRHVPDEAILAGGARLHLPSLLSLLREFTPADGQGKGLADVNKATLALLGMDLEKDLLAQLGPDVGFYVAPPPTGAQTLPDMVFGLAVRPNRDPAEAEEALTDSLRMLGGLLAMSRTNEGKPTVLKRARDGNAKITHLWSEHDLQGEFQPAAAVKNGWLLLASHPDAIRRFTTAKPLPKADSKAATTLVRASFRQAVAYLKQPERTRALVSFIAQSRNEQPADVRDHLEKLTSFLSLFDTMEIDQVSSPGRLTVHARLDFVEPLPNTPAK